MSQSAFAIPNESGAAFRGDVNTALQALASLSSGSTAPTTTYAYQLWVDTSGANPILRIRNGANNAWIQLGQVNLTNFGALLLAAGAAQTLSNPLLFSNTDYMSLPIGNTAQRPAAPANGMIRYNSDILNFEGYTNGAWGKLGGGSAGGGGGLNWIENDNSPTPSLDSVGNRVFAFAQGQGQTLNAAVKVPHSYVATSPIKLYMPFYTPDTTVGATVQLLINVTLIRPGTSAINSTTNQRVTTNAVFAVTASSQSVPQMVTFDLTSAAGAINSVNVQADDILLISVTRAADTSTVDAQLLAYNNELTFA